MSSLLDGILGLDPLLILAVTGLLVFAEDAIFVGFVIQVENQVGRGIAIALVLVVVIALVARRLRAERRTPSQ